MNFTIVYSDDEVYFLDIDFILNNSNTGKIIITKLKNINSINVKDLKKQENRLKDLEIEISKVRNIITKKELNDKVESLKKKINLYRLDKDNKTKEFKTLRDKELKVFFEKLTPLVEDFMKKNSIGIIIDKKNIFIANSKYDITEDVIEFLNQKN